MYILKRTLFIFVHYERIMFTTGIVQSRRLFTVIREWIFFVSFLILKEELYARVVIGRGACFPFISPLFLFSHSKACFRFATWNQMFLEAITYGVCVRLKNGENNRKKRVSRKYSACYERSFQRKGRNRDRWYPCTCVRNNRSNQIRWLSFIRFLRFRSDVK